MSLTYSQISKKQFELTLITLALIVAAFISIYPLSIFEFTNNPPQNSDNSHFEEIHGDIIDPMHPFQQEKRDEELKNIIKKGSEIIISTEGFREYVSNIPQAGGPEIPNYLDKENNVVFPVVTDTEYLEQLSFQSPTTFSISMENHCKAELEPYVDLHGCDLSYMYLQGKDLQGANLQHANLEGADLSKTNLGKANLKDANLKGANLEKANLNGADLSKAYLQYANLAGANLQYAKLSNANLFYAELQHINLSGADLSKTYLQYANLAGANLFYANLKGANLKSAFLSSANLVGTNLQHANLASVGFFYADLQHADLQHANLQHANLDGTNLQYANLQHANLEGTILGEHRGVQNLPITKEEAISRGAIYNQILE